MSPINAALLGLLQGFTEFLPVSSSGHLVLARALMGLNDVPVLFDVILHMATLLVVLWVFRERVRAILLSLGRGLGRRIGPEDKPNLVLAGQLAAASGITAIIGFGISGLEIRDSPRIVSALLLVTAAILVASAFFHGNRGMNEIGWKRALSMGAAQGLGVFPGISRSGITIGSGMMSGMGRSAAGEFSFLLSIPAVGGAFLLSLKEAAELSHSISAWSLAAGFLAALVAGYAALHLLLWLIKGGRLWLFAIYLVPAGIWGLVFFAN